jgi:hypothetical protein
MRSSWVLFCVVVGALAAGCGGDDEPETVGDLIETVSEAVCRFQERCDMLEGSVADCVDAATGAVCGEGNCDQDLPDDFPAGDVDDCVDDIGDADCASTALPASCQALIPEGEDDFETAGDFADAYAEAVCDHFESCDQLEGTYEQCLVDTADEICTGAACDGAPPADDGDLQDCLDDIDGAPCTAQEPPASCNFT